MVGMDRLNGESTMPGSLISIWLTPSALALGARLVLGKGTVHLWRIPLDSPVREPTEGPISRS